MSRPSGRPVRPTLEAVAEAAGVSRGTASRALNGSPNVSPRALAAVQKAAADLGYRPNLAARWLAMGRSESVGLVVSETDERLFGDPFFAAIVRGVHAELRRTGTQLVLALAQSDEERHQVVRFSSGRHLDGVLLISVHGDDPLPRDLSAAGIPVVMAGRPPLLPVDAAEAGAPDPDGPWWVDADNVGGGRLAAEHLLAAGRRRIATITGPQDMAVGRDRLAGFESALAAAGCPQGLRASGDFSQDSGRDAMSVLLQRFPDVDGVFAANDLMALGALEALREAGRRVPQDVAVVGFDDIAASRRSDPPLTTVAQPIEEMGQLMARLLLARVRGEEPAEPSVVLPVNLVVRASA